MSISQALQMEVVPVPGISFDVTGRLRSVIDRIHAAGNIDEIMTEVSRDICEVFDADRLTIYTVSGDRASLVSRVKTGLDSCQDLRLPINEQSIAGFVALHKKVLNFKDVYDRDELRGQGEFLRFLQEVDKRTGYRTKQMLVVPIPGASENDLLGWCSLSTINLMNLFHSRRRITWVKFVRYWRRPSDSIRCSSCWVRLVMIS